MESIGGDLEGLEDEFGETKEAILKNSIEKRTATKLQYLVALACSTAKSSIVDLLEDFGIVLLV